MPFFKGMRCVCTTCMFIIASHRGQSHYNDVITSAMASEIIGVSIFARLFRRRSNKTSKLRVTALCEGNSPVTGEFPTQMASNAENVSMWWRHHAWWRTSYTLAISVLYNGTVKPVYNDHLMGYFSAFWSSSRWPRATLMSSRRQKLLARVNWYLQSSLKHITELITGNKCYYKGGRCRQVSL